MLALLLSVFGSLLLLNLTDHQGTGAKSKPSSLSVMPSKRQHFHNK